MTRDLLRTCQFSLTVAVILCVVLLAVDGISLANNTLRKARYNGNGARSLEAAKARPSQPAAGTDRLAKEYGSLPLSFESNQGQTDPSVQFVSHGSGYALFLEKDEAILELQKPDETDALLQKMDPKTRKRFEARKFYHASPRFSRQRKGELVHVRIAGASPDAKIRASDQLPGKSNYFVGNEPQKWHVGIPSYRRVEYEGIYPGVNLVYYGSQRQLEFDFVVAPHADPSLINLHIQTDGRLRLAEDGGLRIETSTGSVVLHRPDIYQLEGNKRTALQGGFVLKAGGEVSFQIAEYDRTRPLIIDPILGYSTFLGGSASDFAGGIVVDSLGDAYIVGQATSTNFPTVNGYPSAASTNGIAFISELNPTGTAVLYSTYLGGTGGEGGNAIALDPSASVCVTGYTFSTDFPVVSGFQTSLGTPNGNAFMSCINTSQSGVASLVYSTYLGGGGNSTNSLGDTALGIAVDASSFAYVTGQTASDASVTSFPTTSGAYQTTLANTNGNAFLTVVDTNQSGSASLAYSTYLGGDSTGFGDYGMGVAVDSSGDAFITGETTSGGSTPFPITSNAYQTTLNSVYGNVFITEIATTQSGSQSLVYSSYMGGSSDVIIGDSGSGIALDSSDKVYVDGDTSSSDFPVTSGAFQTTNSPGGRAFVAKFDLTQNGTQSLIYSTYLGGTNGSEGEVANGLAVDANGDAFASGSTSSTDFPTTTDAYQTAVKNDLWNVYLTQMNPTGTGLLYSTYLGGSCNTLYGDLGFGVAVDWLGNAYIDGSTCSTDFPIYPSTAYQTALGGTYNAFVAKFALSPNPGITATASPVASPSGWDSVPVTVSFTCVPGAAPIQSCPSPTTVSSQGANQVVSGTVVDTTNNTATASVTVNIDSTPPVVSITSPANGATVSTSNITVTGSVSDALSGVENVACNNVQATVASGTFSCTLQLSMPSTTITVSAFDVAGNLASSSVTVNVSMAAPTSLQITPGNSNLPVGSTQSFTAVDSTGTIRPDATWSVSNTSIANFVSSSPNTLSGIATGQVTLTASIGSVSAQTTVTVVSGALSPGTVLWTATPLSGFTPRSVLAAVPSANGPDVYSVENSDSTNNQLIRAFKGNGEQLWQTEIPLSSVFEGDSSGGILVGTTSTLTDLNGVAGAVNWQYTVPSGNVLLRDGVGVGLDGTVYAMEEFTQAGYDVLDIINGQTGGLENQIQLATGSSTDECYDTTQSEAPDFGQLLSPMIAPDGSVYLELETTQMTSTCNSIISESESLLLFQLTPSGSVQYTTLASSSGADFARNSSWEGVIPDGEGGVLAGWTNLMTGVSYLDDVSSGGVVQSPVSNLYGPLVSMVLSSAGTAFATDSTSVVDFSVPTLQQTWTYTPADEYFLLVAASPGGGLTGWDGQLGLMQLDSSGNASQLNTQDFPLNGWNGEWYNRDASTSELEQVVLPTVVDPDSVWATQFGNPEESSEADELCGCNAPDAGYSPTPDPPPNAFPCPICSIATTAPNTAAPVADCLTFPGNGLTYLLIVGDQGTIGRRTRIDHNVHQFFGLTAQTEANNLLSRGDRVIACRASTVQQFESALLGTGKNEQLSGQINGGVDYYGHSGPATLTDPETGAFLGIITALFVGQSEGAETNINGQNVPQLGPVSRANTLAPSIFIVLHGCEAGLDVNDYYLNEKISIAQLIAIETGVQVQAYKVGTYFSPNDAANAKSKSAAQEPKLPDDYMGILYLIPDGAPGSKKPPKTFSPNFTPQ